LGQVVQVQLQIATKVLRAQIQFFQLLHLQVVAVVALSLAQLALVVDQVVAVH
jgi:hypothetical protein